MTRKRILLVLAGVELISAAFALRDLAGRSNQQVRGTKRMWRWIIAVHPGNSLAYWVLGRRLS